MRSHAEAAVLDLLDGARDRVVEGRPAAVAVELGVTRVELGTAGPALVHALGLGVDVLAGPGRLGAGLTQDAELGRGEADLPLFLGGGQGALFSCHASTVRRPRRRTDSTNYPICDLIACSACWGFTDARKW